MNSKLYQTLIVIILMYICGVAIYITWGLYQIQVKNNANEYFYYTLNEKVYKLKIADTTGKQAKGLSHIKTKPNYDGMIFIFKDKASQSFWNQGLGIDLKVLWLNDFKLVGESELSAFTKKGIEFATSPEPVNYVIELFK